MGKLSDKLGAPPTGAEVGRLAELDGGQWANDIPDPSDREVPEHLRRSDDFPDDDTLVPDVVV